MKEQTQDLDHSSHHHEKDRALKVLAVNNQAMIVKSIKDQKVKTDQVIVVKILEKKAKSINIIEKDLLNLEAKAIIKKVEVEVMISIKKVEKMLGKYFLY